MSISIDGATNTYLSAAKMPPSSVISFCCWVCFTGPVPPVGTKQVLFSLDNSAAGAGDGTQGRVIYLYTDSATAGHFTYNNPFGTIISNFGAGVPVPIANNTWVFVAFAIVGTTNVVYWKYAGGAGFYSTASTAADTAFTPSWLSIGSDSTGSGSVLTGLLAGVRVWNGYLNAAEFELESQCLEPTRTADLWADWRFDSDKDLIDRVHSNVLTASIPANFSQGPNPPIPEHHIQGVV